LTKDWVAVLDNFANHGELPESLAKQIPKVKPEKQQRRAIRKKSRVHPECFTAAAEDTAANWSAAASISQAP
jgi:hypothetical protein